MLGSIAKKISDAKDFSIFFIGDSITEGFCATDAENTYVAVFAREIAKRFEGRRVIRFDGQRQLADDSELLCLKDYGDAVEVQDGKDGTLTIVRSGIGGNTVQRMLNRKRDFICREVGGRDADLFIINVGINDALFSDPKKYVTVDVYGKNLEILIEDIEQGMSDTDIILVTPSYNDLGLSDESCLDGYSDMMKSVARKRNIPVIDLHKVWMEHLVVGGENYGQGDWLTGNKGDSCHPCDKGHAVIADVLIKNIFGS